MANIKGITIEINGDTTKLTDALQSVNREIKNNQSDLKELDRLLKIDPGNTELLAQKQNALTEAIAATKTKLDEEKLALEQLKNAPQTELTTQQQEALTREIIKTEQSLKALEDEYKNFGSVAAQQLQAAGDKMQEVGGKISGVGTAIAPVSAALMGVGATPRCLRLKPSQVLLARTLTNSEKKHVRWGLRHSSRQQKRRRQWNIWPWLDGKQPTCSVA